jgi:hypothetical protein
MPVLPVQPDNLTIDAIIVGRPRRREPSAKVCLAAVKVVNSASARKDEEAWYLVGLAVALQQLQQEAAVITQAAAAARQALGCYSAEAGQSKAGLEAIHQGSCSNRQHIGK